ncbi:uncharacterized protein KD926_003344 [Aspergillus affinis]|uniref:uncharacterized protein n=1 Tax=Aspergillus affinis TaxID=1070780 RepID=UPI0022FE3E93|nr:uncharacterized protein KD926_003344 [Aspergillus affinis]KAI9043574.1 hypothetical protein KD926_003344 [Aspergillus affinis]
MSSMVSQSTNGGWIEREYKLNYSNWQVELHELISSYILTCRQKNDKSVIQRGRSIKIETSVDDAEGRHYEGPAIKIPVFCLLLSPEPKQIDVGSHADYRQKMTSVCAECFRCCRRYMVEPLVPFFERHFCNSQVLVVNIHYGVEDAELFYQSDVDDESNSMQIDGHSDEGNEGDDDTEADTEIEN